jgi:tetratricopeptide (TPR) repeat protein
MAHTEETALQEELIRKHLNEIDSLLNYGQLDQAVTIAEGLKLISSDNPLVDQTVKRVTLEKWKNTILDAADRNDYGAALTIIDSALTVFPGHKWCLNKKAEINDRRQSRIVRSVEDAPDKSEPLSAELQKEVDVIYREAQDDFAKGELQSAVELWEKVERLAPGYQSVREYLVKAYRFVGVDLYSQNKLNEAVAIWKKAVKLEPGNGEIRDFIDRTETEIRKTEELSYDR